jgi:ABC-type nitrate/sulfonate/bicarbonate transport system permease component
MQARHSELSSDRRNVFWSVFGVVAVLAAWQLSTATFGLVAPLTLPSPQAVFNQAVRLATKNYAGTYLGQNIWASLQVVIAGWLIGVVLGVPVGVMMGWSDRVRDYLSPLIEVLRPMPPAAWIPFAVLWFGISVEGRIFVIALSAIKPCIINSYGAVRACDPVLAEAARCLGASNRRIITTVVVPSVASDILAGIRIAIGSAWMTLVAAELVASSAGLGFMLIQAQYALQPSVVLVCMVVIGLIGAALSITLGKVEAWLGAWK